MNDVEAKPGRVRRMMLWIMGVGPGIFLIGYNIGTGSVTTMASAGSRFGMSLFWALFFSCLFTYVMLVAYGKYTLVTGETALSSFRKHFRYGTAIAVFIMVALILGEIAALMGIMGIVTELIKEWSRPLTPSGGGFNQIAVTLVLIVGLYYLLWVGRYTTFEKMLVVFVAVMGLSFILSMVLVIPHPKEVLVGMVPHLPKQEHASLIAAGMAGTTLSAVLFIMRSIVVSEKGWTVKDLKQEKTDALVSASLMLILSAAIMACAAGTLYKMGIPVERAIDMVKTLEPVAGRFATSIFITGIVGAGLSTVFPIILIAPWLICDFSNRPRDMHSPMFRILGASAILLGLVVPVFGGRPVWIMIASQAFQAMLMPMVTLAMMVLMNRRDIMGEHKAGFWMNFGVGATFVFSFVMAYDGFRGLLGMLGG